MNVLGWVEKVARDSAVSLSLRRASRLTWERIELFWESEGESPKAPSIFPKRLRKSSINSSSSEADMLPGRKKRGMSKKEREKERKKEKKKKSEEKKKKRKMGQL